MSELDVNGQKYASYRARGASLYKVGLFPEGPTGRKIPDFIIRTLGGTNRQINGKYVYFPNFGSNTNPSTINLNSLNKKMGGQTEFFRDGERVLDIGSGAGVAVSQLKLEHPGVYFVGLDRRYGSNFKPAYKNLGDFASGDWNHLPFKNNSFTRILSLESFPKHAEWIWDFADTFKDITRVSERGTIWRGTHEGLYMGAQVQNNDWLSEMTGQMTHNGWDVYINNRIFIAKLINK